VAALFRTVVATMPGQTRDTESSVTPVVPAGASVGTNDGVADTLGTEMGNQDLILPQQVLKLDKQQLDQLHLASKPKLTRWRRLMARLDGRYNSLERMIPAMQELRSVLKARLGQSSHLADPEFNELHEAVSALVRAAEAHLAGDAQTGWRMLNHAEAVEVMLRSRDEVAAGLSILRSEVAGEQMPGRYGKTVADLLHDMAFLESGRSVRAAGTDGAGAPMGDATQLLRSDRALLRAAMELRNVYYNDAYGTIQVTAARRVYLLFVGFVLLIIGVLLLAFHDFGAGELDPGWVCWAVLVAGMLGAVTSAVQRLAKDPSATIPAQLGSFTATLSRPFIGGVAAVTLYLTFLGGLVSTPDEGAVALVVLSSFGAGFTERLVVFSPKK
jgi:hypothetical protein